MVDMLMTTVPESPHPLDKIPVLWGRLLLAVDALEAHRASTSYASVGPAHLESIATRLNSSRPVTSNRVSC